MMRPAKNLSRILLTCRDKARLQATYVPALRLGGWDGPIQVVSSEDGLPDLEGVAGVLLSGGGDIHPRHWDPDEPVHPAAEVDEARDELELPLIREAWTRRLPMLGICRGEQALNVALGGSLIQDIPSHFGCAADAHSHGTPDIPEVRHQVSISGEGLLASVLRADTVFVNSRHHQAVARLAPGFRAVAWALDQPGIIEAIEPEERTRWVLGVQWHPENLVQRTDAAGEVARRIFASFAKAVFSNIPNLSR